MSTDTHDANSELLRACLSDILSMVTVGDHIGRAEGLKLAYYKRVKNKGDYWEAMLAALDDNGDGMLSREKYIAWEMEHTSLEQARIMRNEMYDKLGKAACQPQLSFVDRLPFLTASVIEMQIPTLNVPLRLQRDASQMIAGRTWPASIALLTHAAQELPLLRGKRILELGAGTGAVGIGVDMLLSQSGGAYADGPQHSVIITDLGAAMPVMARNVSLNRAAYTVVAELCWGETSFAGFEPPVDVILMADVAYLPQTYGALAATVAALSSANTLVLHGYTPRAALQSERLFDELSRHGFTHEDVTRDESPRCPDVEDDRPSEASWAAGGLQSGALRIWRHHPPRPPGP